MFDVVLMMWSSIVEPKYCFLFWAVFFFISPKFTWILKRMALNLVCASFFDYSLLDFCKQNLVPSSLAAIDQDDGDDKEDDSDGEALGQ